MSDNKRILIGLFFVATQLFFLGKSLLNANLQGIVLWGIGYPLITLVLFFVFKLFSKEEERSDVLFEAGYTFSLLLFGATRILMPYMVSFGLTLYIFHYLFG